MYVIPGIGQKHSIVFAGKFWSVEMALPFNELISGTGLENNPPNDMEVWFLNFARFVHAKNTSIENLYSSCIVMKTLKISISQI